MPTKGAGNVRTERGQRYSLRTKLLIFATALILIPGAIYGAISLSSSRAALAQVIGRQLVEEARNGADRLTITLRSERERFASFAVQDVMREIRIADLDKRISSFLVSAKRGCPTCVDLLVLDQSDRVVASSNPAWIGEQERAVPGGTDSKEAIEGPFRTTIATGSLVRFTVSVPDPDTPQLTIGRLVALVDWEQETDVIVRTRANLMSVGLNVDVLILDERGIVIRAAVRPDGPWQLGGIVPLRLTNSESQTTTGYIDTTASMLVGHTGLPDDLPSWTVVVAEPLINAFAPAQQMAKVLALILTSTLLIALATALFAARRVTQPLTELTKAAEDVGRGVRLEATVPVRSSDEIGILTDAFNRMAADLKRAERELVEAAKFSFVGQLAAGVAHEVRTPLGVLRSSAQLLQRSLEVKDDESRELLQLLQDEVDRIERVVSALLTLGRPRTMHLEPSPLGHIVFRTADFVDAQARHKQIIIRRHPIDPDLIVQCDPELIHQVALNLLVNAVQLLPEGGLIDIRMLPAREGYAGFAVHDNGPGMSKEVRTRIFEPFFTRREGGTGLGLTFVQRVVQEHHGRVTVESQVGQGTVFRVTLPTVETSQE